MTIMHKINMKFNKIKLFIFAQFIIILVSTQQSYASGWVDDWLTQSTSNSPSYFAGQERGYYSAGSFSTRWKASNTSLVTLESPKVKTGCGGIDLFLGGFSFLDTTHLVAKLQSILSSAAATAFDLALKTTCQQCANTIKNLESMADTLNQMQIDDCAAGKSLVGIVADEHGIRSREEMSTSMATAINNNKLVSGVETLWTNLTTSIQSNNGNVSSADVADIYSGCNTEIQTIFLSTGYVLYNIANRMGIDQEYADLIRGLVGDVHISSLSDGYTASFVDSCPENNMDSLAGTTEGQLYKKTITGINPGCVQITDTNRDLTTYVANQMQSIATKMASGTVLLTTAERNFLDTNPLSLMPTIKVAVASNTTATVIPVMADLTAKAYSLQMLSDLYQRARMMQMKALEILQKKAVANSSSGTEKCATEVFASDMANKLQTMIDRVQVLRDSAREAYVASAQEVANFMILMSHLQENEDRLNRELSMKYGQSVVNRISRK